MNRRFRDRLTYANVMATLAFFLALGGAGFAAVKLKKNSVSSKQIKDGQVRSQDLADGAVSPSKLGFSVGSEIGKNSITGAQIDESTLQGVDAAKVGGLEVKRINLDEPFNTPAQNVVVYPGIFRIEASCYPFGDYLDMAAFTAKDHSQISVVAVATNNADDTNGQQDLTSRRDFDFNPNEGFEVDSFGQSVSGFYSDATVQFSTRDGFISTAHLHSEYSPTTNGCKLTGVSIGG